MLGIPFTTLGFRPGSQIKNHMQCVCRLADLSGEGLVVKAKLLDKHGHDEQQQQQQQHHHHHHHHHHNGNENNPKAWPMAILAAFSSPTVGRAVSMPWVFLDVFLRHTCVFLWMLLLRPEPKCRSTSTSCEKKRRSERSRRPQTANASGDARSHDAPNGQKQNETN